jgi:hypothetical protein
MLASVVPQLDAKSSIGICLSACCAFASTAEIDPDGDCHDGYHDQDAEDEIESF